MSNSQVPQESPPRVDELTPAVLDRHDPSHHLAVGEFRQLGGIEFLDFADLARLSNEREHLLHAVAINELFRRYGEVPLKTSSAKLSPGKNEMVRPSSVQTATFMSLLRKIESGKVAVRTEGEFVQLIVLETMRQLFDLIRARKPVHDRKQRLPEDMDVPTRDSSHELSVETKEARLEFRRWLGQILGEADIYLFEQRYAEGRETADLAAEYAITSDTMRVRLLRLRERIKERLGELPFDAEDLFQND